jgi:hypothetical protein
MRDGELSALVFELKRARSPVDRARAMARAWRTIRKLSPTDRRMLAREMGFDGAEDLVEGLAGKSGGIFAPAAVLEALGRMRLDEDLTVRSILSDLRDPERRDDLLVRGIDLAAGAVDEDPAEDEPPEHAGQAGESAIPEVEFGLASADEDKVAEEIKVEAEIGASRPVLPPSPPVVEAETKTVPETETQLEPEPEVESEADQSKEPEQVAELGESSSWDLVWQRPEAPESVTATATRTGRAVISTGGAQSPKGEGSVLHRLQAFRDAIPGLSGARQDEITEILDSLPEPWARRRALVALIDGGVPGDADAALDLIEELDRPMDRRWCLAALAQRGDLDGDALERALEMLASPAAKRRVAALANAAG